eukprot:TRINITY_DN3890_c0_g4_i1.p1 TRINITY_DN3890_c0_g4~~TRINITY_DN3890_c0_g4_i1.p1  ORF type:complete len:718 (+),score=141.76 TRINITY_DN3890_c0_g4_i1:61-2154(+)
MARINFNIAADANLSPRMDGMMTARRQNHLMPTPRTARDRSGLLSSGMLSARGPKTPKTPLSWRGDRSSHSIHSLMSPRPNLHKKISSKALSALRMEESEPGTPATMASVDIPKLSLGDVGKKDKEVAAHRKRKRISTDREFFDFEKVKKKLEEDGMDINKLKDAFGQADVDDSGLDLTEFRNLWRIVFPQRELDDSCWKYIDNIFCEIDNDNSGEISWEEILTYLDKSRTVVERGKPPTHWRMIIFRFVGYNEEVYDDSHSLQARLVALYKFLSQLVVVLSIVILMIESLPSMQKENQNDSPGSYTTFCLETFCVSVFTVEFIAWMISYPESERWTDADGNTHVLKRDEELWPRPDSLEKVKWSLFFKEQTTYVDFLSIVPYYLTLIIQGQHKISALASVRLLRLLRLLRITRILRLGRSGIYGRAPELGSALQKSVMSLLFLVMLITISATIASSFMFYAELDQATFDPITDRWYRDADSDYTDAGQLLQMQSIPEALWWGIVTLTTVGYGDLYPVTIGGKIIASITMLGGLIVVGYPITILTGTFQIMEIERFQKEEQLDRCREFYQGIKTWLQTQGDVKQESDGLRDGDGERTKRSSMLTSQPANNANQEIRDLLNAMENRIAGKLSKIVKRIHVLERESDDETSTDGDDDDDDSDSSSHSDSTSTVSQPEPTPHPPSGSVKQLALIPSLAIN